MIVVVPTTEGCARTGYALVDKFGIVAVVNIASMS